MPITGQGWELRVERLSVQQDGAKVRTYGAYQAHRDGQALPALAGHVCECPGPGDNVHQNGKRIEAARYPLWTQFGPMYRSTGYSTDLATPGRIHMPGIRLEETGNRTHILVHPGHPPDLYLSSIGCLNLTKQLASHEMIDFSDSRSRVIALLDSLRGFAPAAFASAQNTRIANAWIVIDGEPV